MFTTSAVVAVTDENCVGCRRCVAVCPSDALEMQGRLAVLDEQRCVGCFKCLEACHPYDAISVRSDPEPRVLATEVRQEQRAKVDTLCAAARLDPEAAICVCTGTTAAEVAAAVLDGVHVPEDLTMATGVRAKCGMWCLTPTMRLLAAHGVEPERSPKDRRIYTDGSGTAVALWTIPDDVADRYPEYALRESLAAVERDEMGNSPTPWFPDVRPGGTR